MKASEAPTQRDENWNEFRCLLIDTITGIEADMQNRRKGINGEILTCEVAERLNIEIDTPREYRILELLVVDLRDIAREALDQTRKAGGQYSLFT